ncbi:MAG: DUF2059 domain-containing protein [Terriglobales bacterium]
MKRLFSLILAMMLTTSLWAQQPQATPPADAPATREDVLKLFDTLRIREQMERVVEMMNSQMRQTIAQVMRKQLPDSPPEELAHLDNFMQETVQEARDLYPLAEMLDDMIPTYQKHLTRGDIQAIMAFYQSPVGQKLLKEQPAMSQEAMQLINAKMQPRLEQFMERIKERVKKMAQDMAQAMSKKRSQTPPPSPPPPKK